MFGYYIEQSRKLDSQTSGTVDVKGFNTSIKGFKTIEEAQVALQEAQREIIQSGEYLVIDSRVYEYEN